MLRVLRIRDLAIIDTVEIELHPGMTVLTGETGAGKSMITGALDLLLGARGSADMVRSGQQRAIVEGVFTVADTPLAGRMAQLDLEPSDDGELIVRRVVARSGRTRIYANGTLLTASTLRRLMEQVVDVSGQHAQYALLQASTHRALLDRHGGLGDAVEACRRAWQHWSALRTERRQLEQAERERLEREDFLRFQHDEIASAELQPGEDERLAAELGRLRHAERIRAAAARVEHLLTGGAHAVATVLVEAGRELADLERFDPALGPLLQRIEAARVELEDVAFEVGRHGARIDSDPAHLERLEARHARIEALLRKYGPTLDDVLRRQRELADELARFDSAAERLAELGAQLEQARAALEAAARTLTARRRRAARALVEPVERGLAALAMPQARFRVRIEPLAEPGPTGADAVVFEVATNPGEGFRPLARCASGGELSRILLAIKAALMAADPVPTAVFDEVDTGVGGAVAERLGHMLRAIAAGRQVVAVTHLPQVAAVADHHLLVRKRQDAAGRTTVEVVPLEGDARVDELARMLGGVRITRRTRDHAAEMLRLARQHRRGAA